MAPAYIETKNPLPERAYKNWCLKSDPDWISSLIHTPAKALPNDPRAPMARWFFHLSAYASKLAPLPNEKTPQQS